MANFIKGDEIYRRNLAALKAHHPELFELAQGKVQNPYYNRTRNAKGYPNVLKKNPVSGEQVPYYDLEDPLQGVDNDLRPGELQGARLVVLMGMGIGLEVQHFVTSVAAHTRTHYMVVIEADPDLFRLAMHTTLLEKPLSHPKIIFLVGRNQGQLYARLFEQFRVFEFTARLRTLKIAYTRGAMAFKRDYYRQAAKTIGHAAFMATKYYGNAPHDSLRGMFNTFSNIPTILQNPGIQDLAGAFREKPAIIASAGPSLAKQIPLLRDLQDRALIIAADGSLGALLRNGIRPHLVTSIERDPPVARLFEGFDVSDIYLAGAAVLHPQAFAAYNGPKLMVYRNYDYVKLVGGDKGKLDTGPSAGNMAFEAAAFLGCNPIILTGQDLAFGKDGKTHAVGTVHEERKLLPPKTAIEMVPGNSGELVKTNRGWFQFLKYYEVQVDRYCGTCINTSEDGALIQGAQFMPLEQAAALYLKEPFDALAVIRCTLKSLEPEVVAEQAREVWNRLTEIEAAMDRVMSKCDAGYKATAECIQSWDPAEVEGVMPYLEDLLKGKVIEHLNEYRREAIRVEQELFQTFMVDITQCFLLHWEMKLWVADKDAKSAEELVRQLMPTFLEWFKDLKALIEHGLFVLRAGKRTLAKSFPDALGDLVDLAPEELTEPALPRYLQW